MNKKLDFVVQAFVNYNIYARVYERFLLQIVTNKVKKKLDSYRKSVVYCSIRD